MSRTKVATEGKSLPPFVFVKTGQLYEAFQATASHFQHMMLHGKGIQNMGMGETLTRLNNLYVQVGAHYDIARELDKEATLESCVSALEYVRSLEPKEEEEVEEEDEN